MVRQTKSLAFVVLLGLGGVTLAQSNANAPKIRAPPQRNSVKAKNLRAVTGSRIVPLAYFAKAGSMYQNSMPALVLSDRLLAVRMDKNTTLQEIANDYQFYFRTRKYTRVRPIDVDLHTRWVLMETDTPLNFAGVKPTAHPEAVFEEPNHIQLMSDLSAIRAQNANHRSTASAAETTNAVFAARIESEGEAWTNMFQHASAQLRIDQYNLAPQVPHMRCHPDSPAVESNDLQESVVEAQGLKCESLAKVRIYRGFDQQFKLSSGVLDFVVHREGDESVRSRLLRELASDELKDLKKNTALIEYSSPVVCEATYMTDSRIDAYYCTRSLRGFPSLSDSVLIFGRLSGQKYVYNMIRTSGFNTKSTGTIAQTILDTMETNQ
jgi:hypothetical protein